MRFFLTLIFMTTLSGAAQLYFPWWVIGIVCFLIAGISGMNGISSFVTGFVAIALLWGGYALFLDWESGGIMSARMTEVFPFAGNGLQLVLVTAVIGGLVGGMASLTGSLGRWMVKD